MKEDTKIEVSFGNKAQIYSFNNQAELQMFIETFEKTKTVALQSSFMNPNVGMSFIFSIIVMCIHY